MFLKVLIFICVLFYFNSISWSFKNEDDLLEFYEQNILIPKENDDMHRLCFITKAMWVSLCDAVLEHLRKEEKYKPCLYVIYKAYNVFPINKCQPTTLTLSDNRSFSQYHIPCYSGPKVISADKVIVESYEFYSQVSFYPIKNETAVIVLEKRQDVNGHILLDWYEIDLNTVQPVEPKLFTYTIPKSIRDQEILNTILWNSVKESALNKTLNILDNMTESTFMNMCCVLFERSEYEDEFKCLAKELQVISGSISKQETCFKLAKSEQEEVSEKEESEKIISKEILVCFENNDFGFKKNLIVQGYSCPGFQVEEKYKLISGLTRHSVIVLRRAKVQKCYFVHELIYDLYVNYINFIITK